MTSGVSRALALLFPPRCPLCGKTASPEKRVRLCEGCAPLYRHALSRRCPNCKQEALSCRCTPQLLSEAVPETGGCSMLSIGFYDPDAPGALLSRLVFQLKERQDDGAAQVFARGMASALVRHFAESGEDVSRWIFVFPPRSAEGLRRYGFDQAERLSRAVARLCGARSVRLFRRQGGGTQKTLSAHKRRQNAESSLRLMRPRFCAGKRFVIVDDIITSGATVAQCARLLRANGAAAVFALSALKTLPRRPRWFA